MPALTFPARRSPAGAATPPATRTIAQIVDWRADERVRRLDARDADLARQAEQAAAALETAIVARETAQAAYLREHAGYLRGELDERPATPADPVPEVQLRIDALAGERAQHAELRPGVEAQAQATATAALLEIYRPAVARLLATLEAAREADAAVADLWIAAHTAGLSIPAFAFGPLLDGSTLALAVNRDGRDLDAWRPAATAFVGADGTR